MDQYRILLIISLLCLVPARSKASNHESTVPAGIKASNHVSTAEEYWKSVLPNTPIPKTIQDLLRTGVTKEFANDGVANIDGDGSIQINYGRRKYQMNYGRRKYRMHYRRHNNNKPTEASTSPLPDTTIFYLYNDLHPGKTMKLLFTNSGSKAGFLPRPVAGSIPFSSDRLPEVFNYFGINPTSREAQLISETIEDCEDPNMEGEDKFCATSLESLIDLNVKRLGKSVQVISTHDSGKKQEYTVASEAKRIGGTLTVCHKERYPYAVYYCHEIKNTDVYVVPLVAADGTKIKAITVCHMDTSAWSPNHIAFQILKVKPGPPVCHFLAIDTLVWVKN